MHDGFQHQLKQSCMKLPRMLSLLPRGAAAGAAVALLLLSGCATYDSQTADFARATEAGSVGVALTDIEKRAEKSKGTKDEIVWRLEQGASLRAAGLAALPLPPAPPPKVKKGEPVPPPPPALTPEELRALYLQRSIAAFDEAEARIVAYDEQAKVKVGSEIGAALTNLANLPYRGRAYDKIMANAYKGINYLQLGEKDKARVEFNRSMERQREAVAENERRIAEAQAVAESARAGNAKTDDGKSAAYDVDKAVNDPKTGSALSNALAASTAPMKPYGDYVNPFAVFLDGLFFTLNGENGADWERGRKSMERVAEIVPENTFIKADLELASQVAEGKQPENITYVFFETGAAPSREEVRIDIPTFLVTSKLAYVGAAFPKLRFHDNYIPSLSVTAEGQTVSTSTIASMDSIVANDFKNEWPTIVTKTIVTAATKAIAQAAVQKQLDDNVGGWGSLIGAVAMSVANMATTIADTRTWTSLPKEFQYARIVTPADRTLTITAGGTTQTVTLAPGAINVVYAKSSSNQSPLYVSQFALR